MPERREEGSGGLLSVTVNPYACKGCNLCVDVCPDEALITVKQDEAVIEQLQRNWKVWDSLPDTPERFLQVSDLDEGIGVLHTLMLRKDYFHSMVGGDGSQHRRGPGGRRSRRRSRRRGADGRGRGMVAVPAAPAVAGAVQRYLRRSTPRPDPGVFRM